MSTALRVVVTSFLLIGSNLIISCGGSPQPEQPPFVFSVYDVPTLSEFDRMKKPAKPTAVQAKRCLQLRADELAKDPESFKIRRLKIGHFVYLLHRSDDRSKDLKGYIITAETDSKNSYGGYGGYTFGEFYYLGPDLPAITGAGFSPCVREASERWDRIKAGRKIHSDDKFRKIMKENFGFTHIGKDVWAFPQRAKLVTGEEISTSTTNLIKIPKAP